MIYSSIYNEKNSVINRLAELLLEFNNGIIIEDQINYVIELMEYSDTYPFISVTPDGIIKLEYDYNDGKISNYLEFNIDKDLVVNAYHRVIKGIIKESEYFTNIRKSDLNDLINKWKDDIKEYE